ncbi:class I SAM-dependent methyltransferase [Methylobacter sp. S3L5C]|uniref:class I SAM-dependent methyltransferase n=1 Tax=Methylobacter sp. S3L5C TaxID=2839024 RepID=UPI001FAE54CB|nr:methyltransferase domain-containing protein [Methylobacter sp. S3L5C]UOA08673.1 class I SAM-dependent methyltransferase [Methylobacter sp. S3L5C]
MKRNFLFAWYQTPRGKLLKELEADYIQKSITVSCQQIILQIGGLGWENDFIDCTLYKNYTILDTKGMGCDEAIKIRAIAYSLPFQSDSVDMIIIPHLLEFDTHRFQTMREVERVLKPEGLLVVLNFNPWSFWVRYQFLWDKKMADSWGGHFISRSRIMDWLKLLNFEVTVSSEFNLDSISSKQGKLISYGQSFFSTAYAVKAIKRRYNIIPLTPVKNANPRLSLINSLNPTAQIKKHE